MSTPPEVDDSSRRSIIVMRPVEEPTTGNEYSFEDNSNTRKMEALKKNPLVPAGAIGTGMVLMAGLFAFKNGNIILSQRLMRARVLAQGATLTVLAASVAGGLSAGKVAAEGDSTEGVYCRWKI